jgi:hypothetical protein
MNTTKTAAKNTMSVIDQWEHVKAERKLLLAEVRKYKTALAKDPDALLPETLYEIEAGARPKGAKRNPLFVLSTTTPGVAYGLVWPPCPR